MARSASIRGQFKIASGALEACQDFPKRIDQPDHAKQVQAALKDLEAFVANARDG